MRVWYCWWLKSGEHQLRLVVYPITYEGFLASKREISSSNHWCFQGLYPAENYHDNGKSTIWRCIAYWKWVCSSVMLVFRGFRLKLLVLPGSVGVSLKGFLDSMGVSWIICFKAFLERTSKVAHKWIILCCKHFSHGGPQLVPATTTTGTRNNQIFLKDENFVNSNHFRCKDL